MKLLSIIILSVFISALATVQIQKNIFSFSLNPKYSKSYNFREYGIKILFIYYSFFQKNVIIHNNDRVITGKDEDGKFFREKVDEYVAFVYDYHYKKNKKEDFKSSLNKVEELELLLDNIVDNLSNQNTSLVRRITNLYNSWYVKRMYREIAIYGLKIS